MNIERGLFRLFLIGLIPVFLYAYEESFQNVREYRIFIDEQREEIRAEYSISECLRMAANKGANMNMEPLDPGGYCSDMGMYWEEALKLSNETGRPMGMEVFNTVLDNELKEWTQKVYLVGFTLFPGLYALASLMLYVAYRILRWGFAGFKSK